MRQTRTKAGGRPRKFAEESRPVTVTLPERTLQQLAAVNRDRARAIVQVTEALVGAKEGGLPPVEVIQMAKGKSLIVISECECLDGLPWLRLISIAPGRYLLTLEPGTSLESLEIALLDLETRDPPLSDRETAVVRGIRECLTSHRRLRRMSKAELIFVD